MKIAKVIIPTPIFYKTFDYLINIENVVIGSLVNVTFSKTKTIGLVLDIYEADTSEFKLKEIDSILNILPLKYELLQFIKWVADYNLIPIGLVFKSIFSDKFLLNKNKLINFYSFNSIENKKITNKQQAVVNFLKNNSNNKYTFDDLKVLCSLNILKTIVKNDIIIETK